ncbi:MAG: hypothetical protein GQ534_06295 [Candidatus Delongbacteria bacterium]|nr:hypothetical protein [Candidatus Delongbacteria bacterium]
MSESCCESSCGCGNNIPEHKMCMQTQPTNFNVGKVMKLTSNPKYFCKCCGRTANEKENLCNPTKLISEDK